MSVTASKGIELALPDLGQHLNTKSMTDLMSNRTVPWIDAVLKADSAAVKNAQVLNPQNARANAYGLIFFGINVNPAGWQTKDGSVAETLEIWSKGLNDHFRQTTLTSPEALLQRAVDMEAAAKRFKALLDRFGPEGELAGNDPARLQQLVDGLNDGCAKLREVAKAWDAAPTKVNVIELDFAPTQGH